MVSCAAHLSCPSPSCEAGLHAASLHAGGGDSVKVGPEGEEPSTRGEEEGEKMQANPSYLPIEMSYKSQEQQYVNVKMAPPDVAVAEGHSKLQAKPCSLPAH